MSDSEPKPDRSIFAWPASMGGVPELEPASKELMTYCRDHLAEIDAVADACRIPTFGQLYRDDLARLLPDKKAIELIEAVARMGNYGDFADHESMRKAVSKLLRRDGIKLPRGKRTRPGMLGLVADLTPLFRCFGLPLATGEVSRLVTALRIVADAMNVEGDPRDELRRLVQAKQAYDRDIKNAIRAAVARGLENLKPHNPP